MNDFLSVNLFFAIATSSSVALPVAVHPLDIGRLTRAKTLIEEVWQATTVRQITDRKYKKGSLATFEVLRIATA